MARLFRADVVCMSVSSDAVLDEAFQAVRALASIAHTKLEIWVGGGALVDDRFADRLRAAGAQFVGASISDLAGIADRRVPSAAA